MHTNAIPLPTIDVLERFSRKFVVNDTDCWIWQGALDSSGYGEFCYNYFRTKAHRVAYILKYGSIEPTLTVDHLCRVRKCVNPSHLEAVTVKENVLRGAGTSAINARKKFCLRGHKYDSINTYIRPDGTGRGCIACRAYQFKKGNR